MRWAFTSHVLADWNRRLQHLQQQQNLHPQTTSSSYSMPHVLYIGHSQVHFYVVASVIVIEYLWLENK